MVAQIDRLYCRTGPWKVWSRLLAYALLEGRPATKRGRFIDPFLWLFHRILASLPDLKKVSAAVFIMGRRRSGTTALGKILPIHREIAFSQMPGHPLVFVGNWENGAYARKLKKEYQSFSHIRLLAPIYDEGRLRAGRESARQYIHGHSSGDRNPSLVGTMRFGIPVLAFDCAFSRNTTTGGADYFDSVECRKHAVLTADAANERAMLDIARHHYNWDRIFKEYLARMSPDLSHAKNDFVKVR